MTVISQQHFIESVADALQYISYYHPMDYIESLGRAYELEESPAAKDAIAQILTNSRMCAEGHRPICQDTGIVVAFVKVGMGVRWDATLNLQQMVDEGVRRAYLDPDNTLRASIVADPAFTRRNTRDNTPAVVHVELVEGDSVEVTVSAKGDSDPYPPNVMAKFFDSSGHLKPVLQTDGEPPIVALASLLLRLLLRLSGSVRICALAVCWTGWRGCVVCG